MALIVHVTEDEYREMLFESNKSIGSHTGYSAGEKLGQSKQLTRKRQSLISTHDALIEIQGQYRDALLELMDAIERGATPSSMEKKARGVFEKFFTKAFAKGVSEERGVPPSRVIRGLTPADKQWIGRAVAREMGYFRPFMQKVQDGTESWVGPRIDMYKDLLEGVYGAGKISGLSRESLLYWTGPRDKEKCPSCEYLVKHNPYTTSTLPTTPRAGLTRCLFNCRDWLTVRKATPAEVESTLRQRSVAQHVTQLERLMRPKRSKR